MKIAYIPSIIMCCCMHVEINIPILSSFAQKTLQKVRKNFREAFLSFGEVFPFCRCVYLKLHQTSGCLLSVLAHLISRRQNLRAKMSFLWQCHWKLLVFSILFNAVGNCISLIHFHPLWYNLEKSHLSQNLKKKLFHIHVQTNCEKWCGMKKVHCGIECISGISEDFKFLLSFLSQHLSLKHLGNSKILLEFYFCEHFWNRFHSFKLYWSRNDFCKQVNNFSTD